jgi:predicted regulator of Ras-like GTPase activity (Roadblock/LC7/MglB family)
MELRLGNPPADTDASPLLTLEIRPELATEIEDLLGAFADQCELDTALVVARSGALAAGISIENGVTIQAVAALVAQVGGHARTLAQELKNRAPLESLFFGEDRSLYIRELDERFFLVAVSSASVPVGVVRAASGPLAEELLPMLVGILVPIPLPERPVSLSKSLRRIALERAPLHEAARTVDKFNAIDQDPFTPVEPAAVVSTPPPGSAALPRTQDSVFEMEDDETLAEHAAQPGVPHAGLTAQAAPQVMEHHPIPKSVAPPSHPVVQDPSAAVFELDDEDEVSEEASPDSSINEPLSTLGQTAAPAKPHPAKAKAKPSVPPPAGEGPYYF